MNKFREQWIVNDGGTEFERWRQWILVFAIDYVREKGEI